MKPSEVPAALRKLADQFEALGVDDGGTLSAYLRLNVHHVDTREQLLQLLPLLPRPQLNSDVPCISGRGTVDEPYEITLFHKAGLLGGERREVFVDSQAGLDALMAEFQPRDPAELDNAAEQAELAIHHGAAR